MAKFLRLFLAVCLLTTVVVPGPARAGDGFSFLGGELLAGDMGAGIMGSVMGSLIQLPGAGGMLSSVAGRIPVMGAAMLLGHFGLRAVNLMRDGNFSWGNLMSGQDWIMLLAQTVGASLGSTMAAMMIPGPMLGVMVGAALGSIVFTKALDWARDHFGPRYEAALRGKAGGSFAATPPLQGLVPEFSLQFPKGPLSSDSLADLEDAMKQRYREFLQQSGEPDKGQALAAYREARTAYHAALKAAIRQ